MHNLTEFQQRAAAQAVLKLLQGEAFYISDVRKLAELLNRQIGGRDWLAMEPLHCMKWGDMDPELRLMLREKVLEILGLPAQTIDMVEPAQTGASTSKSPTEEPKRGSKAEGLLKTFLPIHKFKERTQNV